MPFTPTVLTAAAGLVLSGLLVSSGPPQPPSSPDAASPSVRRTADGPLDRDPAPARGSWPLRPPPPVVSGFDRPESRWSAGHRGVDLLGRPGQPVHTALAGTVSYVGRIAGRGIVSVDHGAVRTTYQPVAATVRRGQEVAEGQVVGRLLLAGSHCHPRACLHWGLIRGKSTYLDPLTLVGAVPRPVRLFPW
jgi:murein DD-endopeptidase MepM/ murein hydrolase activator NlpD